jgi:hypothetical protein
MFSKIGSNLNEFFNQSQKEKAANHFSVIREVITSIDSHEKERCPLGNFAYLVEAGNDFSEEIAAIAQNVADMVMETIPELNCGDGFGETTPLFDLAHALEHLTVADLIARKAYKPSQSPINVIGDRTVVTAAGVTAFWINNNFSSEEEVLNSVRNAIACVNKNL